MNTKKYNITELLIFIVGTELVGALSALLSGNFSEFYNSLVQPPFAPPGWIFPVVWAILYAVMGFSAYLVYSSDNDKAQIRTALTIYAIQLFINFSWSIVFFRFNLLTASSAVIIALLIMVGVMIISFWRITPLAGYINIPYLIWVAFATYLNIGVAVLN